MKRLALIGLASLTLAGCGPGHWHGGWGEGPRGPGDGGPKMTGPGTMPGGMDRGGAMMGGTGMGMMLPMAAYSSLDLTEKQRSEIDGIHDELHRKHWSTMGEMRSERAKLREYYWSDKRDPEAVGKTWDRIGQMQRDMARSAAEAQNRIDAVLTPEQRAMARRVGARSVRWGTSIFEPAPAP